MSASPQIGTHGRTCSACRFFDEGRLLCRFNAPTVVGWPSSAPDDWCGEWTAPRTVAQANEGEIPHIPTLSASDDVTHRITPRAAGGRR